MKKNIIKRKENKKYICSERPNLFEPNVYISMVVTLAGRIAPEELEQAVQTAYAHNEATMSRIVLEESGEAFYETLDESGCSVCHDQRNWEEIVKESEKLPFDLNHGELVRTYIMAGEQETTLLLMVHHLAGDGTSVLILVQDIVTALDGRPLVYKPMLLTDREYLTKRARLPLVVNLLVHKANRSWKKQKKTFSWEDYYDIHRAYWAEHTSDIIVQCYSLAKWKTACPEGITLNSYLTAKLLQEDPESKVIGIPVSIREKNNSISNQTSGAAITHLYQPELSLEENAGQIQKKLKKQLKKADRKYFVLLLMAHLEPALIDSVLLYTHGCYSNALSQKMAEILGYTGENSRDLGVTNLMKIGIPEEYGMFRIADILFIPPKVSYTKKVVGAATYGETLHVVYHKAEKKL